MTVNISGGQVNIAKDNATINAIHNNGMNGKEFETIIQAIKDNLSGLKKEDGDEILDVLEQVNIVAQLSRQKSEIFIMN